MRKGKRLPFDVLSPYLIEAPATPGFLDWPAIFGNAHPVELEVGFGKGLFLLTTAQAHPDVNYLGIEIDRGLQLYAANRIAKRELRNVRLVKADVRFFIRDFIAEESLQAVHIYFPDPWWKKRHKKRRVFTEEFARQCERILVCGGRLHVATDVEEYFGVMTALVSGQSRLRPLSRVDEREADHLTNFERKAKLQGRSIWRASYMRSA